MSAPELERSLQALAADVEWPPTPELRLELEPRRRRVLDRRRALVLALALLVLAIGAGSLFFSHVNDAGFWLVKEYFGMTVGQTLASWSVMETVISVVGLIGVLLLSLVV